MFGFGKKIDPKAVTAEVLDHKALLVDVRENDEWDRGHAREAIHLSLNRILNGELPTKDPAKKIYMYCALGGRSSMAASFLQKQGLNVENLGGLGDWKRAGGAVEVEY